MNRITVRQSVCTTLAITCACTSLPALATEGGGGIYPNGTENYMVGAMPPPGLYYLVYGSAYEATKLRDNRGHEVPVSFNVKADALAGRVIWVTNEQILGGQLALHVIAPLVNLKVRVDGMSDRDTGLGDMTFGPGLGYHVSDKLHYVIAVDVNAPTGNYDRTHLANIGRNYWNIEPLFCLTYFQPSGLNADLKLMYDFNLQNKDTHYRSGQEIHADFAAGWGLGNGWVLGVGGYAYQQVTADKDNGGSVPSNKGRSMALGPSLKYDAGKWFITAKLEKEFAVRNRPEGAGINVKAVLPF